MNLVERHRNVGVVHGGAGFAVAPAGGGPAAHPGSARDTGPACDSPGQPPVLLVLRHLRKIIRVEHLFEQGNQQLPTALTQMIIINIERQAIGIAPAAPIAAQVGSWVQQNHAALFRCAVLCRPRDAMSFHYSHSIVAGGLPEIS